MLWTLQSLPLICDLSLLDSRIYSYILTDHGEIAAKNTSSLNLSGISKAQFQKLKGNADSSFHSGDKYYNCRTLSNGWLHVTEIPESYIQGNTHILIRALLITVLIFLLLTVIIVILFSENLTRKITALSYAMEAFQLGYDPEHLSIVTVPHPDDPSRYDEIDRLGITFEDMQAHNSRKPEVHCKSFRKRRTSEIPVAPVTDQSAFSLQYPGIDPYLPVP